MLTKIHSITFIAALSLFVVACSDDDSGGPTGFGPGGETGIAGVLTTDAGINASLALADDFEGAEALSNVAIEISGPGGVVLSTDTDGSGRFSGDLEPGTYMITIRIDAETEMSFTVDVAEGEMLFARGKVQTTPSGKFMINLKIVRDQNGDGSADDTFSIRIMGREAGEPMSGVVEIQADGENEKVAVCHIPPGNPENSHTIVVSESALDAHLRHGDVEGACDGDVVDDGDDGDEEEEDENGDEEDGEKVLVCHIPPGNPDNPRTIEISPDALDAHLNHGDTEGECPEPETDDGGDGDGGDGS